MGARRQCLRLYCCSASDRNRGSGSEVNERKSICGGSRIERVSGGGFDCNRGEWSLKEGATVLRAVAGLPADGPCAGEPTGSVHG